MVVPPHLPQNGLAWDFVMALGYVATALLLVVPLVSTRTWFLLGGDAAETRPVLDLHRLASYLALVYLIAHIVGVIVVDTTVIEYLKPSAPWSMLAALCASILILVSIIQSEFRLAMNMRYRRWRVWHCVLSALIIAGMFYHIFEASYFTHSMYEKLVLATLSMLTGVIIFTQAKRYKPHGSRSEQLRFDIKISAARAIIYATLLATILLFVYTLPNSGNRAEKQILQCLIGDC